MKKHFIGATYDLTQENMQGLIKQLESANNHIEILQELFPATESAPQEAIAELRKAQSAYPPFNSPHEGFSILNEEVFELWEHVRAKQGRRNVQEMRKEAIQVAAMALRFAEEVCGPESGQK